jgi:uncharacterized protein
VKEITQQTGKKITEIMGNSELLKSLNPQDYTNAKFGIPTIRDILQELEKPGRDPRPEFKTATFKEGIEKITDLKPGMLLEGIISNVTNFGAFVDIGVHQDGLVHISALTNRFVKDPHEIVKAGQIVKVKVTEIDVPRKRIALTMRLDDEITATHNTREVSRPTSSNTQDRNRQAKSQPQKKVENRTASFSNNAFADAFASAKKR